MDELPSDGTMKRVVGDALVGTAVRIAVSGRMPHRFAVQNYIHHNPVKHGYAEQWEDWPFSSAMDYIAQMGHDVVAAQWKKYPVLEMGAGWDD